MSSVSVPALELDLSIGGIASFPPGASIAVREIDDYEFVWILDGDATWTCDGTTYPAPPGTVILVRHGMKDSFRWDPVRPSRVAYLHFQIRNGRDTLPPEELWPRRVATERDDVLQPLFRQVVRLSEDRQAGWVAVAHSAACHLLRSFVGRAHQAGLRPHRDLPAAVERALAEVSNRWQSEQRYVRVPLAALAHAAAVSPRHLSRLFNDTFAHGPVELLRLARLEVAADLLRHTDMTLDRIAHLTGFANAFHLSRAFKGAHGIAPRAYRTESPRPPMTGASSQARRLLGIILPRPIE